MVQVESWVGATGQELGGYKAGLGGYTQVLGEGHTQVSSGGGGGFCSASSWSLWGLSEGELHCLPVASAFASLQILSLCFLFLQLQFLQTTSACLKLTCLFFDQAVRLKLWPGVDVCPWCLCARQLWQRGSAEEDAGGSGAGDPECRDQASSLTCTGLCCQVTRSALAPHHCEYLAVTARLG